MELQPIAVDATTRSRFRRLVVSGVDRVPLILMAVFVAASVCVTFGLMLWWVFLPVAAVFTATVWRSMPRAVTLERASLIGSAVAIGGALLWLLINLPFASEYLVPIRDPGLYFLNGVVVGQTGGIGIDVRGAQEAVRQFGDGTVSLGAFGARDGVVQLQGSSGFPALLAVGYWIGGLTGITHVNLIIGALGLVALYGLARRIVGPYFGLIPSAALSIGMPYVYLSRTTYTEILATLLLVAAATWIISAFETLRTREFVVAGMFVGAAGLTRIDGAVGFAGVALGLVLVLLGTVDKAAVARVVKGLFVMVGVAVALLGLGVLDLAINHVRYLVNLGSEASQLWIGSAAILGIALTLFLLRGRLHLDWGNVGATRAATIAAVVLGGIFVFWLSRPLWMMSRYVDPDYQGEIVMLQAQDGLPIDPARDYNAFSLIWYAWYWGWPFLLLAAFGVCVWVYRAFRQRDGAQLIIIAMIALTAMLYINTLRVTPDQVWAFRRILPIITPALLVGFAIAIQLLWQKARLWRVVALLALGLTVLFSGLTWGKIFFTVEGSGQVDEIEAICDAVGDASLVVLLAPATPPNYQATLRAVCGAQLITIEGHEGMDLAPLVEGDGGKTAIVAFDAELVEWTTPPLQPTAHTELQMWNRHLMKTPRTTSLSVREVFVGILDEDGIATPVPRP